jgi:hypothetical protein
MNLPEPFLNLLRGPTPALALAPVISWRIAGFPEIRWFSCQLSGHRRHNSCFSQTVFMRIAGNMTSLDMDWTKSYAKKNTDSG